MEQTEDLHVKTDKEDILKRLKRIEGQVKGIQRMIEENKECGDVLTQVAAIRAAINKVGGLILDRYSKTCMRKLVDADEGEKAMEELMSTLQKFLHFID